MSETQPSSTLSDTQPRKVKKAFRAGFWISLLVLIAALSLGSFSGYQEGIRERVNAKATLVSQQLGEQFALAQQDFAAGRYDIVRQRLEAILKEDAQYPGAAAMFADVLVKQSITPTAEPTATPTLTPTPDMRSQEAIFAQAQQQMQNKDWPGLLGSLDSLRKADPTYKAVLVDGMYYTALRNRGIDQIMGTGAYKTTNMEGGLYDLTLAERFGPLDGYADGLRTFTRMYITGASFWDMDWSQAVNYFRQVYQFAPNLRDASNITAARRLHDALLNYGDQMVATGKKLDDRCRALDLWSEANNILALDGVYATKFNQLDQECNPPTEVPQATADPNLVTPNP
jgi:hypothetical protein